MGGKWSLDVRAAFKFRLTTGKIYKKILIERGDFPLQFDVFV